MPVAKPLSPAAPVAPAPQQNAAGAPLFTPEVPAGIAQTSQTVNGVTTVANIKAPGPIAVEGIEAVESEGADYVVVGERVGKFRAGDKINSAVDFHSSVDLKRLVDLGVIAPVGA